MARHCSIKGPPIARVRSSIIEGRRAKLANEAVLLTMSDDIRQMFPNGVVLRPFGRQHPVSQRLGMIGSAHLAQFTDRKAVRIVFHKQTQRRKRPHEPVKQRRINVKFCRDGLSLLRAIPSEMIKYPKLGAGIEDLAAPPPVNQIEYFVSRRVHVFARHVGSLVAASAGPLCYGANARRDAITPP